jgi:sortase A
MADGLPYLLKPGVHTHNISRSTRVSDVTHPSALKKLRTALLVIGLACLGYFAWTVASQNIYQSYANWAFEKAIATRPPAAPPVVDSIPIPPEGSVLGRVSIDRLNLSAMVRQGVDEGTLKRAVGHVPSTALPGQPGNFAIAAHRDTLFRVLKDIHIGDEVTFQTQTANFRYQVMSTKIVKPTDVSVLRPEGKAKLLTMITCYPFYYVGSAPKRFIVQARLMDNPAAK